MVGAKGHFFLKKCFEASLFHCKSENCDCSFFPVLSICVNLTMFAVVSRLFLIGALNKDD